jgi:hypothetical protein
MRFFCIGLRCFEFKVSPTVENDRENLLFFARSFSSLAQRSAGCVVAVGCVGSGACPEGKALVAVSFASKALLWSLLSISLNWPIKSTVEVYVEMLLIGLGEGIAAERQQFVCGDARCGSGVPQTRLSSQH